MVDRYVFIFVVVIVECVVFTSALEGSISHIEQRVDQFGFSKRDTFRQRYLVYDQEFVEGGPIFFYCGGEMHIETHAKQTVCTVGSAKSRFTPFRLREHFEAQKRNLFRMASVHAPRQTSALSCM